MHDTGRSMSLCSNNNQLSREGKPQRASLDALDDGGPNQELRSIFGGGVSKESQIDSRGNKRREAEL